MCLLAISMSSFVRMSVQIFSTFLLYYFFILEFWESFIWLQVLYQIHDWQVFSLSLVLSLNSLNSIFQNLMRPNLSSVFSWIVLLDMVAYLRTLCLIQFTKIFSFFFSRICLFWHVHVGLWSILNYFLFVVQKHPVFWHRCRVVRGIWSLYAHTVIGISYQNRHIEMPRSTIH